MSTCKSNDTRNISNGSTHTNEHLEKSVLQNLTELLYAEIRKSIYTKKMPSVRNMNVPFLPFLFWFSELIACVAFKKPSNCFMPDRSCSDCRWLRLLSEPETV